MATTTDELVEDNLLAVFRDNICLVRDHLGISQVELARRAERSASYICDVERGRRKPNLSTVAIIAHALGVSVSDLLSESLGEQLAKRAN